MKAAICSISGTSMMTLSSALMSLSGQEFREPEHLSNLTGKLMPFLSEESQAAAGWLAHYGMGSAFAYVYVKLWDKGKLSDSYKTGAVLGGLSGLIGIMIWKATFKVHPFSPVMNYNRFYLQRLPAHLVFAIFAKMAYRLIKERHFYKSAMPDIETLQTAKSFSESESPLIRGI